MTFMNFAERDSKKGLSDWNGAPLRFCATTDVGMVRKNNEDSYVTVEELGLFVVADGMGGRAGGEVASALAVETVQNEVKVRYRELFGSDVPTREIIMRQAINTACLNIYSRSLELPHLRGMGTTTTALWLPRKTHSEETQSGSPKALVTHVGDSRCYLLRAGLLYQLTLDHSLFQEKVRAGVLSPDSSLHPQLKSQITRCVGYEEDEEVDLISFQPYRGDRFLLCSDGLSNKISDNEIAELLSEDDLPWVAEHMVALAKERGGEDNITVILVALEN
jgi:serine/threonine protein phosphatase PrpC